MVKKSDSEERAYGAQNATKRATKEGSSPPVPPLALIP